MVYSTLLATQSQNVHTTTTPHNVGGGKKSCDVPSVWPRLVPPLHTAMCRLRCAIKSDAYYAQVWDNHALAQSSPSHAKCRSKGRALEQILLYARKMILLMMHVQHHSSTVPV